MKSLLLINEDQRLHGGVRRALGEDEYRVWWAPNTETGMELLGELPVDLVIAEYVTAEPEEQNVIEALGRIQPNETPPNDRARNSRDFAESAPGAGLRFSDQPFHAGGFTRVHRLGNLGIPSPGY